MTRKEKSWRRKLQSSLCMIDVFDEKEIDSEILSLVLLLRKSRFQTISSCQGKSKEDPLHCSESPYVMFLPDIGDKTYLKTMKRLHRFLRKHKIFDYTLSLELRYSTRFGADFVGIPFIYLNLPQFSKIPQFQNANLS